MLSKEEPNKKWGNKLWNSMHLISFTFPNNPTTEDKQNFKTFYYNIINIIPCNACKEHYTKNLQSYPIDNHLNDTFSLVYYIFTLHNQVNQQLNKPQYKFVDLLQKYLTMDDIDIYTDLLIKYKHSI